MLALISKTLKLLILDVFSSFKYLYPPMHPKTCEILLEREICIDNSRLFTNPGLFTFARDEVF